VKEFIKNDIKDSNELQKILNNNENQNNANDESLISNSSLNVSRVFNQELDQIENGNIGRFFVIPFSKYLKI